ncbi:MAG TPA: AAA family ATPase [Mycolicibacillus parakoreensis]|uniref:AAA family ATPase n=1 Tax=Mycolicibacillus parakoreensis TaxID=1069221 RepID=A0ABY3U522_9MYCO|nr:AAA family ATPase [Mycolicibacillus parakoreensis]ULN52617.1 AAA family ATPase [Mycolicibacillus parakoreensis]HLR98014.1 AAA family ATPase [Mycolicibacillus parakoreensis]
MSPEIDPDRPNLPVAIHETHSGIVVLIGERAYKAKKPVVTDFLDFSTLERREQVCAREVELNSRLAADTYLGIARFSDPTAATAEPVIVMRRYPDSARLATVVRDTRTDRGAAALRTVAGVLAGFHDGAERGERVESQGRLDAVRGRWRDNITEMATLAVGVLPDDAVATVERLALRYLAGREALFDRRIAERRIVDGHGDLLADDIFCLPDGVQILDCLEFDDALRHVDAIDDAAFLAMDLEFLGRADLAELFVAEYRRASGDSAPASLVDFYIAYRALVRAKTDCVRFAQGHRGSQDSAQAHLRIATDHLRSATVRLAVIGGGPGTGKTTVSHRVAQQVGAEVISTDRVRQELHERDVITGRPGEPDAGLYAPRHVDTVYREVFARARRLLAEGRSVILDGTWREPRRRAEARELAAALHAPLLEIQCRTDVDTAAQRVADRPAGHPSDATAQIAEHLEMDPLGWPEAVPLDTTAPQVDSAESVVRRWRALADSVSG